MRAFYTRRCPNANYDASASTVSVPANVCWNKNTPILKKHILTNYRKQILTKYKKQILTNYSKQSLTKFGQQNLIKYGKQSLSRRKVNLLSNF